MIREKGILEYPLAAADQAGWYLGNEFVNTYLGLGGTFFEPGSAEPAISGEEGLKTLALMKELSEYMEPEFLTFTSDEIKAMYLSGEVAIINQWASMVNGHIDPKRPGTGNRGSHHSRTRTDVGGGTTPAAALWWDGFTIAKNISDEDAAAPSRR